jgi:hypothetical protein
MATLTPEQGASWDEIGTKIDAKVEMGDDAPDVSFDDMCKFIALWDKVVITEVDKLWVERCMTGVNVHHSNDILFK